MTSGTVTDFPYPGDFCPDQAPAWLAMVAAFAGVAAFRPDRPFTWAELGCGQGTTAVTLAAACPHGTFFACDLNAEAVAQGETLAQAAGLTNLHFAAAAVGDLDAAGLPDFDVITLHGLWSWVDDGVRDDIRRLIQARLRPGGLVLVSYDALPGCSDIESLRRVMLAHVAGLDADSETRLARGLDYLHALRDAGAAVFAQSRRAGELLDFLARQDPRHLIHHLLTPHYRAFPVTEVAEAMAGCGLALLGSARIRDRFAELSVPEGLRGLVDADAPLVRETQRDFALNRQFRRDVFWKPRDDASTDALAGLRFAACAHPADFTPDLAMDHGRVAFDPAVMAALAEALATAPCTLGELAATTGLPAEGLPLALAALLAAERVLPVVADPPALERLDGPWTLAPLNAALLDGPLLTAGRVALAAPVFGTGLNVDLIDGLFARAASQAPPDAWPERVRARLAEADATLAGPDGPLTDPDALAAELGRAGERFAARTLPVLVQAGILRPAGR